MSDGFLKGIIGSVVGMVVVLALAVFLNLTPSICSNGVVGTCIDLADLQNSSKLPGGEEGTIEGGSVSPPPPPPPPPRTQVANTRWEGTIDLYQRPNTWDFMSVSLYFGGNGRYTVQNPYGDFDPGVWERNGNNISWISASNTYYTGRIDGDVISGRSENPSGRFYLRRVR